MGAPPGGVNPLGGTMAIEQMPNFGAGPGGAPGYGAPPAPPAPGPAPYGGPPAGGPPGYGPPPPQQPGAFPPPQGGPPGGGFGAPADQGYGGPPAGGGFGGPPPGGGFGGPPGGPAPAPYGAPPGAPGAPPAYGAPPAHGAPPPDAGGVPQGGFGMPGGGVAGAAALANVGNPMGPLVAGAKPKVRNPVMTLVLPVGLFFVATVMFALSGIPVIGTVFMIVGLLGYLGGLGLGLVNAISMVRELQNYTQDDQFVWWWLFIPCLGMYFAIIKVPEQVTKAKTKAGILQTKPTRGIVNYLFIWLHALASDLNDIAQS